MTAVDENAVLVNAHRAEFLHECKNQGMTASEASQCLSDFEEENLAVARGELDPEPSGKL